MTQVYQQARLSRDARFDGTFFVAVTSTGIFCRPICPAPLPKESNVRYFKLAQHAMQAGFRPCLRCRPDAAPQSYAWLGTDTSVQRALRLMNEDLHLSLPQLCARLGLSERYLRVLFQKKLGVNPKTFYTYTRLLFAKQLLQQTPLSIEQVAQACGFGSARRLQDNIKRHWRLSPTQLRKPHKASDHRIHLQLPYIEPYHWPQVRNFLATRAVAGMEEVGTSHYARSFTIDQCSGYFSAHIRPDRRRFDVDLVVDDSSQLRAVVAHIRRVLDLDANPALIQQSLLDAGLAHDQITSGLRLAGVWGTFEAGCRAILGQQISLQAASKLVSQLVETLGELNHHLLNAQAQITPNTRRFFPTPQAVANHSLAFLSMPHTRRTALKALAQFCVDHPQCDELNHWLDIKGIGPWTVQYAKMRGQSNPDIWLESDWVIKKSLAKRSDNTQALDPNAAQPWRSYFTLQLWHNAND